MLTMSPHIQRIRQHGVPRNPQLCEMQTLQISFQNQKFSVIVIACSEGAKDDF